VKPDDLTDENMDASARTGTPIGSLEPGVPAYAQSGAAIVKGRRGFASMDPEQRRQIASKGGFAAHNKGTAHRWSKEEARNAGHKGGLASQKRRAARGK
jgi:general stress protein YciG